MHRHAHLKEPTNACMTRSSHHMPAYSLTLPTPCMHIHIYVESRATGVPFRPVQTRARGCGDIPVHTDRSNKYIQTPFVVSASSLEMSGLFSDAMRDINVRIVVGITNVLTIVGSVFILVSYLCFPSLRTGARLILLHLSLMDLVVGLAHFVGGYTMYWDQHVSNTTFCKAQAFVGYYSIISSVLWTVCLSAYMYCLSSRVTAARTNSGYIRYHIWPSCAVCYGIPLILAFWALRTGRLGYSPYDAAGWCSIVTRTTSRDDFFASAFGFDVWIYLAMILITILYVSSHCFRRLHVRGCMQECI